MDRRTTDAIEIVMDSFRETKKFQNEGFVGYRIDKKSTVKHRIFV